MRREPDALPKELEGRFLEPRVFAIGSTGTLYRVRDAERGREGLLKIVRPSLVSRGAERERLKRELVKQAALSQPHLLLPLDTGVAGSTLWLFRESLEGESLRLRFAAGEAIGTEEALAISAQLAAALDELHRAGLLHRDLHPGHVLLARGASGPTVRVIDAAIAAPLEQKGAVEVRGTPGFVAPEQLKGRLVSFRSDLYALGCVMYELFAGRAPYTSESVEELLTAHAEAPLPTPPAGLPDDVRELLVALLAKDPRERPFSAQQVRRVLDRYLPETDAGSGGGEERVHKETLVGLPIDELAKIAAPAKASPAPRSSKRKAEETDELAIPDILEEIPAAEVARASVRPSSPSVPPPPPPSIPPPMPGRSAPPSPPSRAPGRKGPSLPPPVPSAGALPSFGLPSIPAASAPPPSLPPIPSGVASKPAPAVLADPEAARVSSPPPAPSAEPTMELDALLEGAPPALVPPPMLDLPVGSSAGDVPAPSVPPTAVPAIDVVSPREPRSASAEAFHAPSALNIGFLFSIPSRIRRKPITSAAAAVLFLYAAFSATSEDTDVDDPATVSPVAYVEAASPPAVRSAPSTIDRPMARRDAPAPTPVREPAPEVHVAAAAEPPVPPVAETSTEEESASAIVASSSTARKASPRASSERAAPTPTARAATAPEGSSALDRLRDEARAHFRARRYAKAAAAYEKAIALDGTQAGLHAGLGAAKLALKDYRGAIAAYTQAVRLSPRHSGFQAALGRAYEQAGDRSKAVAAYKQALSLDPRNGAAKQGLKRLGERS